MAQTQVADTARVHMPHTVPSREHTRHQSQPRSRSRSQLHIQALSLFAARVLPVLPYTTPGLAFTARYTVVHTPGRRLPSPSQRLHFSNLVCLSRAAPPSTVTSTSNKVSQDPIDRVVSPSSALVPGAGAPPVILLSLYNNTNHTHSDHPG